MVFFSLFVISLGLFTSGWVKFFFSPQVETEQVSIDVTLPPGTPFSRSLEVLRQLQEAEKALVAELNAEPRKGKALVSSLRAGIPVPAGAVSWPLFSWSRRVSEP